MIENRRQRKEREVKESEKQKPRTPKKGGKAKDRNMGDNMTDNLEDK